MSEFGLPIVLIVLASFFQGTFGLGMKYIKPLSWEAWWLVYALIAMLVFPWTWALLAVPDLWASIRAAPPEAVWGGMLFGFLWGVGGIMFGLSVGYVGMSLTYGIVMGLAASVGSLVPLARTADVGSNPAVPFILAGVVVMLIGVAVAAYAGVRRDQMQAAEGKEIAGIKRGKEFQIGLAIAITSGVLSALLNVGFDHAKPVADSAVKRTLGLEPSAPLPEWGQQVAQTDEALESVKRSASLARWVVVLFGALVMNAGYAVVLLLKNKSWGTFWAKGGWGAYKWALMTGLFWFAALGVYGQGAALMGNLGPVIGWPMLLGLALIISNIWAALAGEWKGVPGPFKMMLSSVAVLITACIILGYSNSL